MSLAYYAKKFRTLSINRAKGHASPHKACMLLAVIDLVDSGVLRSNRIEFDDVLTQKFKHHFDMLKTRGDQPTPYLPFYHLASEGFWRHAVRPGKETLYNDLKTSNSAGKVREAIEYVHLDKELFDLLGYSVAREQLKHELFENVDPGNREDLRSALSEWSQLECELITRDYLDMLIQELAGAPYNKADHRRRLQTILQQRSEGAIEYKHQNISAVLIDLGLPYIRGYKPAFNYQRLLAEVVAAQAEARNREVDAHEQELENQPVAAPEVDWTNVLDEPPIVEPREVSGRVREFIPRRYDYNERESRNRRLGGAGEQFVINFEKHRLIRSGHADLANEVEWTSKERGDGAGFDIRSFVPESEAELFIEVKTTNHGKYQPFVISDNEVAFSEEHSAQYALYRVFEFKNRPRIFTLPGNIREHVQLEPEQYSARFR